MRIVFQLIVIFCILLGFGAAKLRYEDRLSQDMVEARLIQPPLRKGTSLQLGQTGAAVALGGLRSLVASIWNLRAFLHFENQDWIKLEQSYEVITTLQPQTNYYWDTGAWHLHTNASVYYKENKDLSPIRRSAMRMKYLKKGAAFLEEGARQNPDDWRLRLALAKVWSDRHKVPDLPRALNHYEDTLACDTIPTYKRVQIERFTFYTMTRVQSRENDALELGRRLFNTSSKNHTPNLVCCIFALQNSLNIPEADRIPESSLFPNDQLQLSWLKNFLDHRNYDYPMAGVRTKIDTLEKKQSSPKETKAPTTR